MRLNILLRKISPQHDAEGATGNAHPVREVLCSDPGRDIGYSVFRGFAQSFLQANTGIAAGLGHDRFHTHSSLSFKGRLICHHEFVT
jgi:hypothetical protein